MIQVWPGEAELGSAGGPQVSPILTDTVNTCVVLAVPCTGYFMLLWNTGQ